MVGKDSSSLLYFQIFLLRLLCSPSMFFLFLSLSFSRCVIVCSFCDSLILARLSHLLPRQAKEASPPPLQDISQDTCDFIQVSNSQQSPSSAEKGISSQYWALKDLIHCYNRSETFSYFQNIILAISHSIISVQCNVWFSWLQFRLWIFSSLLSLNND